MGEWQDWNKREGRGEGWPCAIRDDLGFLLVPGKAGYSCVRERERVKWRVHCSGGEGKEGIERKKGRDRKNDGEKQT